MRYVLILLSLLSLLSFSASAQILAPYGVEHTIEMTFLDANGLPLEGEEDGGSEVTLTCEGGTPATATNDFAETNDGGYQLTLTASELQCERLRIGVAASVAQTFLVETYGDPDAQHPDLSLAADVDGVSAKDVLCYLAAVMVYDSDFDDDDTVDFLDSTGMSTRVTITYTGSDRSTTLEACGS